MGIGWHVLRVFFDLAMAAASCVVWSWAACSSNKHLLHPRFVIGDRWNHFSSADRIIQSHQDICAGWANTVQQRRHLNACTTIRTTLQMPQPMPSFSRFEHKSNMIKSRNLGTSVCLRNLLGENDHCLYFSSCLCLENPLTTEVS